MSATTLEAQLQAVGGAVKLLRNSSSGPFAYPVVRSEYSNWRDEQLAWHHTCVLFNQSYHMTDMYIEGPGALKLLSSLGVNSFDDFERNKAKHYVVCNYDGYVIGDVILLYLDRNYFNLVGRPAVHHWVQYHSELGRYDVTLEHDECTAARSGPVVRKVYRFQIQGPNALKVISKVIGKRAPDIKFFNMTELIIAGHRVSALRHGMLGQPGFELFGSWADGEEVRMALVWGGAEYGLRQVGARAYSSNALESGWIPSPLPAVYTGEKLRGFRAWLPASANEAVGSLGGSFFSPDIEDYYLTPYELGYGSLVKFDHDFVGREALERMDPRTSRQKVTLALNSEDVTRAFGTMFNNEDRAKYFDFPSAVYSTWPYDKVTAGGKIIGISTWCGYSANAGRMLALAMLDRSYSTPGKEVTFVWGEEGGGTAKPTVERHVQIEIRAVVSRVHYAEAPRASYTLAGRTAQR